MIELTNCPICEGGNISLDYIGYSIRHKDGKEWPIKKCGECGHAFMSPQPGPELLSQYYTEKYDPYSADHGISDIKEEVAEARRKGEFRHIKITPGLRILDVGCGGGAFLRVARELGAIVEGVEPSAHGIKTARGSGLTVFHGTLDEYINENGVQPRFDVITSNHVVEHHAEPVRLLSEMRSLLAPGGYVWFGIPNAESRTARILKQHWHATDLPYHLMQFTPSSASLAVERAGLKIRRQYTSSLPSATMASLYDVWRYKYFIPRKITQRIAFLKRFGVTVSNDMDAKGEGEAIIVEAIAA